MKHYLSLAALLCLAASIPAQDDPDLVRVEVGGLPAGSRVLGYAVVATETGNKLVGEVQTDGTTAFYLFDYVDDALTARTIGARSIPADMQSPPRARPVTRRLDLEGDRFWPVSGYPGTDRNEQLLAAPPLAELRFAEIGESPWQLTPPPGSALSIGRVTVATDGTILDACVVEPNITAVADRMTTGGGWWVEPFGEPHLLVGILHAGAGEDRREGLRLYNDDHELVATVPAIIEVDANAIPDLLAVDLSGDGETELLFFPTAPDAGAPLVVFRFERRSGTRRILAFSLCSVRMNGPDVVRLQRALEARGHGVGPHGLDGWYGPDTRAAVIRFQRAAGLDVTGVVDNTVWDALGL